MNETVEKPQIRNAEAKLKNLAVLAYTPSFTNWHYAAEPQDDVLSSGFFNPLLDRIREGDLITASIAGPKTLLLTVTKNDGIAVSVKRQGQEHQFTQGENPKKKG